jgi:hypothetical protein
MLKQSKNNKAQVMLEFMFCALVVALMLWGTMRVLRWVGLDLSARRAAHDDMLTTGTDARYQIYPTFSKPITMNAIWDGD